MFAYVNDLAKSSEWLLSINRYPAIAGDVITATVAAWTCVPARVSAASFYAELLKHVASLPGLERYLAPTVCHMIRQIQDILFAGFRNRDYSFVKALGDAYYHALQNDVLASQVLQCPSLIERFVTLIASSPDNCRITAMDMLSIAATSQPLRPITIPFMATILSYLLHLPVRWDPRVWYYYHSYLSMLNESNLECFMIAEVLYLDNAAQKGPMRLPAGTLPSTFDGTSVVPRKAGTSPPLTAPTTAPTIALLDNPPSKEIRHSGLPTSLGTNLLQRLTEFLCLVCHLNPRVPAYRVQARELKNSIKALTCVLKFVFMKHLAPTLRTDICICLLRLVRGDFSLKPSYESSSGSDYHDTQLWACNLLRVVDEENVHYFLSVEVPECRSATPSGCGVFLWQLHAALASFTSQDIVGHEKCQSYIRSLCKNELAYEQFMHLPANVGIFMHLRLLRNPRPAVGNEALMLLCILSRKPPCTDFIVQALCTEEQTLPFIIALIDPDKREDEVFERSKGYAAELLVTLLDLGSAETARQRVFSLFREHDCLAVTKLARMLPSGQSDCVSLATMLGSHDVDILRKLRDTAEFQAYAASADLNYPFLYMFEQFTRVKGISEWLTTTEHLHTLLELAEKGDCDAIGVLSKLCESFKYRHMFSVQLSTILNAKFSPPESWSGLLYTFDSDRLALGYYCILPDDVVDPWGVISRSWATVSALWLTFKSHTALTPAESLVYYSHLLFQLSPILVTLQSTLVSTNLAAAFEIIQHPLLVIIVREIIQHRCALLEDQRLILLTRSPFRACGWFIDCVLALGLADGDCDIFAQHCVFDNFVCWQRIELTLSDHLQDRACCTSVRVLARTVSVRDPLLHFSHQKQRILSIIDKVLRRLAVTPVLSESYLAAQLHTQRKAMLAQYTQVYILVPRSTNTSTDAMSNAVGGLSTAGRGRTLSVASASTSSLTGGAGLYGSMSPTDILMTMLETVGHAIGCDTRPLAQLVNALQFFSLVPVSDGQATNLRLTLDTTLDWQKGISAGETLPMIMQAYLESTSTGLVKVPLYVEPSIAYSWLQQARWRRPKSLFRRLLRHAELRYLPSVAYPKAARWTFLRPGLSPYRLCLSGLPLNPESTVIACVTAENAARSGLWDDIGELQQHYDQVSLAIVSPRGQPLGQMQQQRLQESFYAKADATTVEKTELLFLQPACYQQAHQLTQRTPGPQLIELGERCAKTLQGRVLDEFERDLTRFGTLSELTTLKQLLIHWSGVPRLMMHVSRASFPNARPSQAMFLHTVQAAAQALHCLSLHMSSIGKFSHPMGILENKDSAVRSRVQLTIDNARDSLSRLATSSEQRTDDILNQVVTALRHQILAELQQVLPDEKAAQVSLKAFLPGLLCQALLEVSDQLRLVHASSITRLERLMRDLQTTFTDLGLSLPLEHAPASILFKRPLLSLQQYMGLFSTAAPLEQEPSYLREFLSSVVSAFMSNIRTPRRRLSSSTCTLMPSSISAPNLPCLQDHLDGFGSIYLAQSTTTSLSPTSAAPWLLSSPPPDVSPALSAIPTSWVVKVDEWSDLIRPDLCVFAADNSQLQKIGSLRMQIENLVDTLACVGSRDIQLADISFASEVHEMTAALSVLDPQHRLVQFAVSDTGSSLELLSVVDRLGILQAFAQQQFPDHSWSFEKISSQEWLANAGTVLTLALPSKCEAVPHLLASVGDLLRHTEDNEAPFFTGTAACPEARHLSTCPAP